MSNSSRRNKLKVKGQKELPEFNFASKVIKKDKTPEKTDKPEENPDVVTTKNQTTTEEMGQTKDKHMERNKRDRCLECLDDVNKKARDTARIDDNQNPKTNP